jgi:hypothetical protein
MNYFVFSIFLSCFHFSHFVPCHFFCQVIGSDGETAVKVTTYVRAGESALIVLTNFGSKPTTVKLTFNWTVLGMEAGAVGLRIPKLRVPVQKEQDDVDLSAAVAVPALQHGAIDSTEGVILLLEKKK